jgi:uncharacterized membrane protein YfcA
LDQTGQALLLAAGCVTIGSAVQGAVGFGLAIIAAPLLALIDPELVPGPLLCAGLALTLATALREHRALDLSGVGWGLVGRLPGTLLGAAALGVLPRERMALAVGVIVLLGVAMRASGLRLVPNRRSVVGAGFASGFMGTVSSVGGPPIALVYQDASGPRLRATLAGYFVLGSILSLFALAWVGRFGARELGLSLALAPGALLGFWLSGPLLRIVDRGRTRGLVLGVSTLAGLAAILQQPVRDLLASPPAMDPKLVFWTGALVNMGIILALAVSGIVERRRHDVAAHRRRMLVASSLVGAFLVAYVVKLMVLGGESTAEWSSSAVWVLRVHELCVATMLVGGCLAWLRALRLRHTRNATADPADPPAEPSLAAWHRRAGWAAVVASGLGFATALLILRGMYARAGIG